MSLGVKLANHTYLMNPGRGPDWVTIMMLTVTVLIPLLV